MTLKRGTRKIIKCVLATKTKLNVCEKKKINK